MTTKKRNRKIPSTIKARILSESLLPDCCISDLAKSHGVSSQVIYYWRKNYRAVISKAEAGVKAEAETGRDVSAVQSQVQAQTLTTDGNSRTPLGSFKSNDGSQNDESRFVELLVQDSGGGLAIKKASLIFSDFALTLEGGIKSSSLVAILKILEGEEVPC